MLWHNKEDLQYFRKVTEGHTVVMGRKTYESIGKPLPNRRNIVLTHRDIEGIETNTNIDSIIKIGKKEDIFIIGGEKIYSIFLPFADKLYLTEIDDEKDCDRYFPNFDKEKYNKQIIRESEENNIKYMFVIYTRR